MRFAGRYGKIKMFKWALAQLGERLHGMQEVIGSSPICSTFFVPTDLSYLSLGFGMLSSLFGAVLKRRGAKPLSNTPKMVRCSCARGG